MHIADLLILTPEQMQHKNPVNPTSVRQFLNKNHDDAIYLLVSFVKTSKTDEVHETYSFPKPQNRGNEKKLRPLRDVFSKKYESWKVWNN